MDRKKNIPQIRFQNYEDEWVYSTIGRHISLLNGRAYKQEELLGEGKYRVLRVGNFNTNSKWYYSNLELEDNKYVNKGDLLYLWATNFGPEIWTEEKAIYHYHIWKLEFDKTDINQDYLYIWLESDKNKIQQNTNGSTMVHITKNMMEERRISLPSQDEQSAIGSLFRTLDDLLASYKNNLANHKSLKATMLSKMFPKAGQTVPEIRLDGFEGEWELLEINDLADDFQSGGTPKTNVQEYWDGDIPWIQSSDLETNCLFEIKVQKSISEKGLKNSSAKIIPKDSIAVVTRVGVGKLAVMRHEYATSQDFLSLSNLKSNIEFTAYLLYRLLQKEVTQLQGTSIKGITKVELLSKKVLIPSFSEQQAIGAYFSNLDNLIAIYQEKISQLETLKKKLLQDMFI